jgi:hypothetical protein
MAIRCKVKLKKRLRTIGQKAVVAGVQLDCKLIQFVYTTYLLTALIDQLIDIARHKNAHYLLQPGSNQALAHRP